MESQENIESKKDHLLKILAERVEELSGLSPDSKVTINQTESVGDAHENDDHTSFVDVEKWSGTAQEALRILSSAKEKILKGGELSDDESSVLSGSHTW